MTNSHYLTATFLLVVAAAPCMNVSHAGLYDRNHVAIRNALEHNKTLKVHCKSKDNDLGFHLLGPDTVYRFKFHDNFGLSTLYWCNLWQGPHYKHYQVFVAYRSIWFWRADKTVMWEAREDGIYEYVDDTHAVFKYKWDAPHKEN
ncbi:PREDICTED: pumilio homolog 15-like [Tarenaya hassleriana]|uniref:pumilio homolog 15-like n=1 Tax=Tarenaya hassleriana TaxID=28532 RepID=UPI00053C1A58|nr:PREDICTED: pumilio homolog 15-like [Tarenaya hassleriana]